MVRSVHQYDTTYFLQTKTLNSPAPFQGDRHYGINNRKRKNLHYSIYCYCKPHSVTQSAALSAHRGSDLFTSMGTMKLLNQEAHFGFSAFRKPSGCLVTNMTEEG